LAVVKGYGKRCRTLKGLAAVALVVLLVSAIACLSVSWSLSLGGARAESGPDEPPAPVATAVTPVVATVIPLQDVVTPITGMAEATTSSAEQTGSGAERSNNPFAGVRGGVIGVGIALGLVLLATVTVRGARALVKQRHQ
jgi:hypothetical protein